MALRVAAIIVTRGDQDFSPILVSIPEEWELLVWNNGQNALDHFAPGGGRALRWRGVVDDLSVYGRYAAIEYTDADLIYVQDDDCVVSDPQAIVDAWHANRGYEGQRAFVDHVVCNMPSEFRHDFYEDHALVGFGAAFHRDAPFRAFEKFEEPFMPVAMNERDFFNRTCDIVFTALTPRILVDVPKDNLPYAEHYDRMYRQPQHQAERARMRELAVQIRDGG